MLNQDLLDKFKKVHKKFNDDIEEDIKGKIEQEGKILENFLSTIINKSKNLNMIALGLKRYKKTYLKKDSQSIKQSYSNILNISKEFAKEKIKLKNDKT